MTEPDEFTLNTASVALNWSSVWGASREDWDTPRDKYNRESRAHWYSCHLDSEDIADMKNMFLDEYCKKPKGFPHNLLPSQIQELRNELRDYEQYLRELYDED
jgi:hypothetical protein